MSLEPNSGRRSVSPESSGRESPAPRQWRNQLGAGKKGLSALEGLDGAAHHLGIAEETPVKDKSYRKYAAGIDRALSLFETALQEWADYISFLNRLLKVRITQFNFM